LFRETRLSKLNSRPQRGNAVNRDDRFDHIVGLIYDSAFYALDAFGTVDDLHPFDPLGLPDENEARVPDAIVQAIREEQTVLEESFPEADSLWQRLSPHIARSGSLRNRLRRLHARHAIQQTEHAHLPFGMVWVDAGLNVVAQNDRASALLESGTGICVKDRRLSAWVAADMERLNLALGNALRAQDRQIELLALRRRDQPVPLLASVIPVMASPRGVAALAASGGFTGRFALVMLQNPGESPIGLAHLQLVYGFTNAERRLAEALLANDTLDSYAARTEVTRSTLRSHLARLFKKTGTKRQSELVRLLMLAQPAA
jgi:DNA-binding CsgD family transcriptional regulator